MGWGISEKATGHEKIKADLNDFLQGLNSCGIISYSTYSQIYDKAMLAIDAAALEAAERGKQMKAIRAIKCPRCRGVDVYLREHIICYAEWSPGDEEAINTEGGYFKITGFCSCSHQWTLRGEVQINDHLKARLRINKTLLDAAERSE